MRFLPVSSTALMVELADLDETLALHAALESCPVDGVDEIVPAARTLLIRYQPTMVRPERLAADLRGLVLGARSTPPGRVVEVPVQYDGEDLQEVAALVGIDPEEVVRRHTASDFTVAFTGFAPGFAYLVGGDPRLHVPRRQSPRTRIPAGAVGLAGQFSGVYPQASPGGWQIIGTTPLPMWDISRTPAALFQPGMRVRFIDLDRPGSARPLPVEVRAAQLPTSDECKQDLGIHVRSSHLPALFQDLGRPGQAAQGVSASGALDKRAFRAANRAVGNPSNTPCLEIALGEFSFEAIGRILVAVCGAPLPIVIQDAQGRRFESHPGLPIGLEPGDTVELGRAPRGTRAYLAARGGFAVMPVLSSVSTDTLARIGPAPVQVGATITIHPPTRNLSCVSTVEEMQAALPAAGDTVTLDVVMGPRTDWFTAAGISLLLDQSWEVTPQSSRIGMRLAGEKALERSDTAELPSEGAVAGAIQVPHSGQPVLFLADHPLTGGYPVIATVAEHHLDLAGQIPLGARIRFRAIAEFEEIAPLTAA